MAYRTIRNDKDPVLRKKSRPVEVFDHRLHQLLTDLADTMHRADGVGLAAPQVGILRRVCVVDVGEGVIELVNPQIVYSSAEMLDRAEGCLSSPGEWGMVRRPRKMTVRYFDRNGKQCEISGEYLLARAFCHEIDHLSGRLFKDLASRMLDPKELEEEK
jgi:peptide deformylase